MEFIPALQGLSCFHKKSIIINISIFIYNSKDIVIYHTGKKRWIYTRGKVKRDLNVILDLKVIILHVYSLGT